jgi:hypothetical protein
VHEVYMQHIDERFRGLAPVFSSSPPAEYIAPVPEGNEQEARAFAH